MPRRPGEKKAADRFRALVIEADPDYRSVIAHVVDIAGGQSETVASVDDGRRNLQRRRFDIVIMGIAAGETDVEHVTELRTASQAPLLLLLDSYEEAKPHFEAGADQLLPKPFVPGALSGAIKAQLRGPSPTSVLPMASRIELGGATFDSKKRTISHADASISFSRREWELLEFFLANTNRYYEAADVLAQAWGEELSEEQFRTYITRIRRKLGRLGLPMQIVNQPGVGYCMILDDK